VVHFNVTAHHTAEWTAQHLREAFPFDQVPRYLLRDRDKMFGDTFRQQIRDMKLKEVLSAPRSPALRRASSVAPTLAVSRLEFNHRTVNSAPDQSYWIIAGRGSGAPKAEHPAPERG
jgi:hypothetical protein